MLYLYLLYYERMVISANSQSAEEVAHESTLSKNGYQWKINLQNHFNHPFCHPFLCVFCVNLTVSQLKFPRETLSNPRTFLDNDEFSDTNGFIFLTDFGFVTSASSVEIFLFKIKFASSAFEHLSLSRITSSVVSANFSR